MESKVNCQEIEIAPPTEQRSRRQKWGILSRIRKDVVYRRKLFLTIAVCWSYVVLGWLVSQIGPALPDLQRLARIDLETASWIFTSWSIGFVAGSLITGFLYDRFNRLVIMLISSTGMAVCSMYLPYSDSFAVMVVARLLTGIFSGGSDTGANTIIPSTWGSKGRPYMQALYLSYTVGGIVSPLATRPFMSTKFTNMSEIANEIEEQPVFSNETIYDMDYTKPNALVTDVYKLNIYTNKTHIVNALNISDVETSQGATTIHYAFLVTGLLCLSLSASYIVMLLKGTFDLKEKKDEHTKEENALLDVNTKEHNKRLPISVLKYIMLACLAAINMLYGATEDSLGDFLVTFCLDYLEWDNSASVLLLSMYWVSSCLGGIGGVLIMRKCSPTPVLFITLLIWNASFLSVVLASIWKIDVLVWIFIPTSGFSMVFIIPNVISWTGENVCEISGKISSLFMIATGVGLAANPTFIGYMMEQYNYIYFFYILLGESVLCTLLFTVSYMCRRFFLKHNTIEKGTTKKKDDVDV